MIKLKQLLEMRKPYKLPRNIMEAEMNNFSLAYIQAALATEMDDSESSGGEPLDKNHDFDDIEASTFARIIADCRDFQKKYKALYEAGGWTDEDAGKDFWLSRNGHGAGFFDSDVENEKIKDDLQDAARRYGEYNLYLGDNRLIWGS